jgi:hypothetical protein
MDTHDQLSKSNTFLIKLTLNLINIVQLFSNLTNIPNMSSSFNTFLNIFSRHFYDFRDILIFLK